MKIEDFDEAWLDRYWAKVDKSAGPDACWIWTAGIYKGGYGRIWHKKKLLGAHRVAFILSGGTYTPERPSTLHSCHNPACANPAHLRAGSNAENSMDCVEAGRMNSAKGDSHGSKTMPYRVARGDRHGSRTMPGRLPRGDSHPARTHPEYLARGDNHYSRTQPERMARGVGHGNAKLTEDDVSSIRKVVGCTQTQIAEKFGVSRKLIGDILRRKIWRHVA